MSNKVTHFSTVINPESQSDSSDGTLLQRILLMVCFSGQLPKQTVRQKNIPVHISVSVAEEYGPFTSPVMEAISVDLCSTRSNSPLMDDSTPSQANNNLSSQADDIIPFLPLQRIFNYINPMEWATLSKEIKEWLVNDVDTRSQLWTWGCDAFWLTFVAAYPLFPRGKWPMWDPRIPVEGTFIQEWLGRSNDIDAMKLEGEHSLVALLNDIRAEFNRHTVLFHPLPLLAVD
ncbi:uncharacterized protein F5891DRAFT_1180361 [Suillus fuscotomentosus]|uniref:Uncharacterized protein n=1 Tax=Suillus fuscotomentosus TaxID=1912939 RepID=A0AAD4EMA1_9AGAM|nr:uncharacterized protein F5891DRAFT_1180361 [Suillus fuscotomentosus]KAG1908797.1 hypothetical protein F5891DRAFT_1180361 [Suillus fuscotomentosus]